MGRNERNVLAPAAMSSGVAGEWRTSCCAASAVAQRKMEILRTTVRLRRAHYIYIYRYLSLCSARSDWKTAVPDDWKTRQAKTPATITSLSAAAYASPCDFEIPCRR